MKIKDVPVFLIYFILRAPLAEGVPWQKLKCATDSEQRVPEGPIPMERFQWLGVIQHSFVIGGKERYAVTTAALIHPGYAITSADDIAKVSLKTIHNTTRLILWRSEDDKVALGIIDYTLHPDYESKVSFSTLALVQLTNWNLAGVAAPVLPVCLPVQSGGAFTSLYALRITDETTEMRKAINAVNFVNNPDCEEFYYRSQLSFSKMRPVYQICTVVANQTGVCVWDGGAALITRQNWGYWGLIGFGVRGPGCGAPARFINVHSNLEWIEEVIHQSPNLLGASDEDVHRFVLRQFSPYKLIMYKADVKLPSEIGQCEKKDRGSVMFKDAAELLMNKNFGQGFFYVEVWQIAQFRCATVLITSSSRTQVAVWLEHHCYMEQYGPAIGTKQPDQRRRECFYYYKSSAYLEFRFFFSFKATFEITLYGTPEALRWIPNPFMRTESTDAWWPTDRVLRWSSFNPYYRHPNWL